MRIDRRLRQLMDVILDEDRQNPEFAERLINNRRAR
jgi:hypothetical protein